MILVNNIDTLCNEFLFVFQAPLPEIIRFIESIFGTVGLTSGYRHGDDGVHGAFRGIDIRSRLYVYPSEVVAMVNEHWTYDPQRPELRCALLHGEGSNEHIHLQVHPRTERIV